MSSFSNLELMQRIFSLFTDEEEFYCQSGVVKELNESNKTCRVQLDNGDPDIQFVKYVVNASKQQGIEVKPKVGSQVVVGFLGTNNAAIVKIQEFDCITYDAGEGTVAVAENVQEKILQLEELCNAIIDALSNSSTASNDGGATYKSAIALALGGEKIFVTTKVDDINYDKIKLPEN